MILPITVYGDPVLRKPADEVPEDYPELQQLIENMFETMYAAHGVGLAAPQIGKSLRLFVMDPAPMEDLEEPNKKVFINPEIVELQGNEFAFEEGCLSIPGIRENVKRQPKVLLNYLDENFTEHEEWFEGNPARVILHEYDHIEGILFIDKISAFKKALINGRLQKMAKGDVKADYRIRSTSRKK